MKDRVPKGVQLHDGEHVVAVLYPWALGTCGFYVWTLGLWEIWRRRHFVVLTNQRVLFGKGIVIKKKLRSLPLEWVQDASYERTIWLGGVQVSSAGGSSGTISDTQRYRPRRAKEFVQMVSQSRKAAATPASAVG